MPLKIHNLFDARAGNHEEIHPLIKNEAFTLEHIASNGQSSDQDFWYDQPNDEWVVLITGTATLQFKAQDDIPLKAGDSLLIPKHCEHRVASTSSDAHWIALHFDAKRPN